MVTTIVVTLNKNVVEIKRDTILLPRLIEKQGGMSDYKFARILGVTRQLWQFTRTGKKGIRTKVLRATVRTYPDLCLDVLNFLRDGG